MMWHDAAYNCTFRYILVIICHSLNWRFTVRPWLAATFKSGAVDLIPRPSNKISRQQTPSRPRRRRVPTGSARTRDWGVFYFSR